MKKQNPSLQVRREGFLFLWEQIRLIRFIRPIVVPGSYQATATRSDANEEGSAPIRVIRVMRDSRSPRDELSGPHPDPPPPTPDPLRPRATVRRRA